MKAAGNTKLPTGAATPPASDPDFNDELPGVRDGTVLPDPDAAEFRDELKVGSYAAVGALQTELEDERQQAEMATLDALEAMRAMDAGDQVKWRISRTGHEDDDLNGYLETWPNHLMTIERIRDRFGGGTFYCKGFRKGKYISHQTLQISGEAKRKPSGVEGVNQSVPVQQGSTFDVQSFLTAQERRDERRREDERRERQEREEREEKRRQERMQMILTLGPAAIGALGGLFSGRQDNTAALVAALKPPDPITMLTQLKALQGSGQDGVLNRILPMLLDMAGSKASGGDTGWLDVLKEFAKGAGPAVGQMIETQMAAARTAAPALPSQSSNGVTGPTSSASGPPYSAVPMLSHPGTQLPLMTQQPLIVVPESVSRRDRRNRTVSDHSPVESVPTPPMASTATVTTAGANSPASARSRVRGVDNNGGQVHMNWLSLAPHLPWLRAMLDRFYAAAVRGNDPEVYAALFCQEIPDAIDPGVIAQLLASADWLQNLVRLDSRWNDARVAPWLDSTRRMIVDEIAQAMGVHGGSAVAPHVAEHGVPTPGTDPRAATHVQVRGPDAQPTAGNKRAADPLVIDRPKKLPSLTGD